MDRLEKFLYMLQILDLDLNINPYKRQAKWGAGRGFYISGIKTIGSAGIDEKKVYEVVEELYKEYMAQAEEKIRNCKEIVPPTFCCNNCGVIHDYSLEGRGLYNGEKNGSETRAKRFKESFCT
jgi:hypothetical protein